MSKGSTVVCCERTRLTKSLLKCADSVFILHEAATLKPVTPEPEETRINGRQGLEFCNSYSQYYSAWHCALAWQILTSTLFVFKEEYHRRNFTEVLSPNMYNSKLWETSGHWQHYSNNMFTFDIEKDTFALKPMNCPGHW